MRRCVTRRNVAGRPFLHRHHGLPPIRTRDGNAFDWRPQQLSFGVGTADMPAATQGVATINGFTFTRIQANWFNPSIAHQYSCSSEAISRLAQQTCAQYVPNGIPLLFAGGGGSCHPSAWTLLRSALL